jgi:hypothetical protein
MPHSHACFALHSTAHFPSFLYYQAMILLMEALMTAGFILRHPPFETATRSSPKWLGFFVGIIRAVQETQLRRVEKQIERMMRLGQY